MTAAKARVAAAAPAKALPALPAEAPGEVMRLARLGAFFPTRLSFMRVLLRALAQDNAQVERRRWSMDAQGIGHAVYTICVQGREYSLVAFSRALAPGARSDRVIADAWDATFALYDGRPNAAALRRLADNVPRQEAGRYRASELVLSRANKSVRFFEHTVRRLAAGKQPQAALLKSVGYLMRTTAVYGNGKFGIADRAVIAARPFLRAPFQAELLTVWLIRLFTFDLAEHIARCENPRGAARLAPAVRQYLGIGNATGLGMAPFLVNHPLLLHQWLAARARALQFVLRRRHTPALARRLRALLERAAAHIAEWRVQDKRQMTRIRKLRREVRLLRQEGGDELCCRALHAAAKKYSLDCQELVCALLLEAVPAVNRFADELTAPAPARPLLQPAMTLAALQKLITRNFGWALKTDYQDKTQTRRFWYVSAEKLEPRIGERGREAGAEKELPLDIARRVQCLHDAIERGDKTQTVAAFLLAQPQHRFAARRVQTQAQHPYSEIHDNLIAETCLPIDMLRFKLSFFGASKFDPKSDLWTRINLFQGAPLPQTLHTPDDWWLPFYPAQKANA